MNQLNAGQQAAVDTIVSGVLEKNAEGYTVVGEGGTGKTFCIMYAAQKLQEAGLKILFAAPTNKAVKQLERAAREYGLNLDNVAFQTWHSALGLAMLPDEENKFVAQLGEGVLELFDVVVGDEASMLSKLVLTGHILPRAQAAKIPLIMMGDDMQLPPVREAKSLAFDLFPILRLTKVERQAEGSEILTVTGLLRTAIDNDSMFKAPEVSGSDVEVVKAAGFLSAVLDAFDKDTDLDKQRVVAWRNRRVDEVNDAIRKKIYGKGAERFEEGERVVTGAPVKDPEGNVLLSTDEECIVEYCRVADLFDEISGLEFKTYLVALRPIHTDNKAQVLVHVLHEDAEEAYWDRLNTLAKRAKSDPATARKHWALYHKFKELFANLKYCYCITIHRSQGSTYDTVFVDVKDILANRLQNERQRLLYVAFSRPRSRLVVNKKAYVA